MQLKHLIQRVQSAYSAGLPTDESIISDRLIYSKLLSTRNELLFQKANKKQKISDWNYQTLSCVELIRAPLIECPCIPDYGCVILKTRFPIPEPISKLSGQHIKSITTEDGEITYDLKSWGELKNRKGNKYTNNKPVAFIRDSHLYIMTKIGPTIINIVGLFADPIKAEDFPSFCDQNCSEKECINCTPMFERDFPIPPDMEEALIKLTIEEIVGVVGQRQEDISNNNQDNVNNKHG